MPKKKNSRIKKVVIQVLTPLLLILFVRAFIFHAFVIPTPSMESSLLVGDMLMVNKMKYGIKLPNTPLSIPFLHNHIPGTTLKSYSTLIELPNITLFKGKGPQRNNVVVFYYPAYQHNLYGSSDKNVPVDKRDYYIKRCIGLPGDSLEIKDDSVFINGTFNPYPQNIKFSYVFEYVKDGSYENLFNNCGIDPAEVRTKSHIKHSFLTLQQAQCLASKKKYVKSVEKFKFSKHYAGVGLHPKFAVNNIGWYGPVYIPKKGETLVLSTNNIGWYKDVIINHEKNELAFKDSEIFINNVKVEEYTFKKDYYFMMGDNRHNSLDSRYWGFIPHDHVVGSPSIIINSTDAYGKIRSNRLFKTNFN